MNNTISSDTLAKAFDLNSYRSFFEELVSQGKTTGPDQTRFMLEYTANNLKLMKQALDEENERRVSELAGKLKQKVTWVLITEPWCGDAAFNSPFIFRLAELSDNIDLRILLRDENPEVIDNYLTNGGRSIPKLVALDPETLEELYTWGARPQELQMALDALIAARGHVHINEKIAFVQAWYKENNHRAISEEFEQLLLK